MLSYTVITPMYTTDKKGMIIADQPHLRADIKNSCLRQKAREVSPNKIYKLGGLQWFHLFFLLPLSAFRVEILPPPSTDAEMKSREVK